MSSAPHTTMHMSPAQAAQAAGVSRWTVMRAIKSHELQATRDNKNQWQIAADDLDRWRPHTVRTPEDLHILHTPEAVIELREKLAAATARADAAEADRDQWRDMAQRLVSQRRSWWPWRK